MHKFIALAAVAASALLVSSANASDLRASDVTAPTVRIAVDGKTDGQVREEIRAAAATVCRAAEFDCVDHAVSDAERQFYGMRHASAEARPQTAAGDPLTVRVRVAGKSRQELLQEIDAAARAVCRPMSTVPGDYQDCVSHAVSSAHDQLRHMAVASADVEKVALD